MIYDITTTLEEKNQLAGDIWHFHFKLVEPLEIEFTAGQYMLLKVEGKYRQYSISSPTHQKGSFNLIVQILPDGLASKFLMDLEVGGTAEFKGPAGVFVLRNTECDKVFLATGTGIAPVKSMIETYLEAQGKQRLHLLFGLRSRENIYLFDEFSALATKYANFDFHYCLSQETSVEDLGPHVIAGRINVAFNQLLDKNQLQNFEYYVCGGQEAVESLREFVGECNVAKERIFFEKFT